MSDLPSKFNNGDKKPSQLTRASQGERKHNLGYSAFIRSMKIALPLLALAIVTIVISWNTLQPDDMAPAKPDPKVTKTIGKNELLNPKFDSIDEKNQPYTITADRALQDTKNDLMLLTAPMADIALNSGNWLAIKSRQGAFRQQTGRLILKDNVEVFHDDGYHVETQALDIDLKAGTAKTDVKISGHGPLGTIEAKGMSANSKTGTLVFTGPAKIVLYDAKISEAGGL